jgi:hypothetical protein
LSMGTSSFAGVRYDATRCVLDEHYDGMMAHVGKASGLSQEK